MQRQLGLHNLLGDPLFVIIRDLPIKDIVSLCSTDNRFRVWCGRKEDILYRYLLIRDFEIPLGRVPKNQAKDIYKILDELSRSVAKTYIDMGGIRRFEVNTEIHEQFENNILYLKNDDGNFNSIIPEENEYLNMEPNLFPVNDDLYKFYLQLLRILWIIRIPPMNIEILVLKSGKYNVKNLDLNEYMNDFDPIDQVVKSYSTTYTHIYPEIIQWVFLNEIRTKLTKEIIEAVNFWPRQAKSIPRQNINSILEILIKFRFSDFKPIINRSISGFIELTEKDGQNDKLITKRGFTFGDRFGREWYNYNGTQRNLNRLIYLLFRLKYNIV